MQDLPYITSKEGIGGKLKKKPEHFIVEEIPLYDPSGKGKHLYINITKKGLNSIDIQKKIAESLNIKEFDIGFAGLKDKNAVTTQTFSVPLNNGSVEKLKQAILSLQSDNVKINWFKLHNNKLKPGHLLGNRFKIIISDVNKGALPNAEKIIKEIKKKGLPNYFGEQRFGIENNNIKKGHDLIKGRLKIRDRWLRRFLMNSYQSYLCNLYLANRVKKGLFDKLIKGDIAKKYDTGGLFEVKDLDKEQKRYENMEISFTAPIYGIKMLDAKFEAKKLESLILKKSEISIEDLKKAGIKGTRRAGRLVVNNFIAEECSEGIQLRFSLPKGSFATVVLREIIKC